MTAEMVNMKTANALKGNIFDNVISYPLYPIVTVAQSSTQ